MDETTIPREFWVRQKERSRKSIKEMEQRLADLPLTHAWSRWMCRMAIKAARRDIRVADKHLKEETV